MANSVFLNDFTECILFVAKLPHADYEEFDLAKNDFETGSRLYSECFLHIPLWISSCCLW